jgi:hypothetical protein
MIALRGGKPPDVLDTLTLKMGATRAGTFPESVLAIAHFLCRKPGKFSNFTVA